MTYQAPQSPEEARELIAHALAAATRDGDHIVHRQSEPMWSPHRLRQIDRHLFSVLARSGDICVFFDPQNLEIGFRDEARAGTGEPIELTPTDLLSALEQEMGLKDKMAVTSTKPVELDGLGWTVEARVLLDQGAQGARAWVEPTSFKIIQWLWDEPQSTASDHPAEVARGRVEALFTHRHKAAKLPGSVPWFAAWADGVPEKGADARQMRVATWRFWSSADVQAAVGSGEVLDWSIPGLNAPPLHGPVSPPPPLSPHLVGHGSVPADAVFTTSFPMPIDDFHQIYRYQWAHVVGGVPVEGDGHVVDMHPSTGAIARVRGKWRQPALTSWTPAIPNDQAARQAEADRTALGIDDFAQIISTQLVVVEVTANAFEPGPVEDRLCWRVRFHSVYGESVVFVDAHSGQTVRSEVAG